VPELACHRPSRQVWHVFGTTDGPVPAHVLASRVDRLGPGRSTADVHV